MPGKVTKLVPFGAFVRVEEGIEGLVHISELAERHVEIPEQVVQVNDDVMVKIIDIDLERRRISLSLKQANEGVDLDAEDFDPTLYGMAASYDDQGNYLYPEGFDPETGEWLEGYEEQRRGLGAAVRRGARALGGAQEAGRGGRSRRPSRPAPTAPRRTRRSTATAGPASSCRRRRRRRVRWPPTRRCRRFGRSSPAACSPQSARIADRQTAPSAPACGGRSASRADVHRAAAPRTLAVRAAGGTDRRDRVGQDGGLRRCWRERGAVVIDADVLAREVVDPGTAGLAAVVERFGADVLTATVGWTGRPGPDRLRRRGRPARPRGHRPSAPSARGPPRSPSRRAARPWSCT